MACRGVSRAPSSPAIGEAEISRELELFGGSATAEKGEEQSAFQLGVLIGRSLPEEKSATNSRSK